MKNIALNPGFIKICSPDDNDIVRNMFEVVLG